MHRIDTDGNEDNRFRSGTPQIGQEGTILGADWFNDVQENICTVIEDAGVALVKGDPDQLKLAIQAMISAARVAAPVGRVERFDGPVPALTHLPLDGAEYNRADYPALVAYYQAQGRLIAGSTGAKFRVPDYRGRFDRAWSADATVDPDGPRTPGSLQDDQFKAHTHGVPEGAINPGTPQTYASGDDWTNDAPKTSTSGETGGAETRPKNVALVWAVSTGRLA
jgi:hypothetical protein